MAYYVRVATRGSAKKGTPAQALSYITDAHDARRDPSYSDAELHYIARMDPGWKTDLEGGRVPLVGIGDLASERNQAQLAVRFEDACQPYHDRCATTGYKSLTLTVPKEVSLYAEGHREDARSAIYSAVQSALDRAFPGLRYSAVAAIHTRNQVGEIHYHVHVLVGKFAHDTKTGRMVSLNGKAGGNGPARVLRQTFRHLAWRPHFRPGCRVSWTTPHRRNARCQRQTSSRSPPLTISHRLRSYFNKGMSVMRVRRPIILNGIDQLATRHDLADRSIVIHLPAIPPANRRSEAEFTRSLDGHKARLLGSIYAAIWGALREVPEVSGETLPRMADFGRWGVALERSQNWPPGSFTCAHDSNLKESAATATEADPIFLALMELMDRESGRWEGTMEDLRKDLEELVPEKNRTRRWPGSPQALSNRLTRLAPDLRREGWGRAPLERGKRGRRWLIARVTGHSGECSSPASPSAIGQPISTHTGDEPANKPVEAVRGTSGVVTNGAEETAHQENVVTAVRLSVGDEDDKGDEVPPLLTAGKEEGEDDSGSLPSAGGQS